MSEHFVYEKKSLYLSKIYQLTEKKIANFKSLLLVSLMIKISNLLDRFHFSAIGAPVYKKTVKN